MTSDDAGAGRPSESTSRQERAQRYREMADGAFLKAQRTQDAELRTRFLALATGWHAMAQELEKPSEDALAPEEDPARDDADAQTR